MTYTTLHPIQKFRHYGYPVASNASARVLVYGMTYCWVLLLRNNVRSAGCWAIQHPAREREGSAGGVQDVGGLPGNLPLKDDRRLVDGGRQRSVRAIGDHAATVPVAHAAPVSRRNDARRRYTITTSS